MRENERNSLRSTINEFYRLCESCDSVGIDIDDVHNNITNTVKDHGGPQVIEKLLVETICCPTCQGDGGSHEADGHDCWGRADTVYVACYTCNGQCHIPADYKDREKEARRKQYLELKEEFGSE